MTDDLVKRLRDRDVYAKIHGWDNVVFGQAADRIEKLEQALLDIFDHECMKSSTSFIACTARDNLWPKKEVQEMTDDHTDKVLRIRYDQLIQLHEKIGRLEDIIARIQHTNLRRDMNAKSRTTEIEKLCKTK